MAFWRIAREAWRVGDTPVRAGAASDSESFEWSLSQGGSDSSADGNLDDFSVFFYLNTITATLSVFGCLYILVKHLLSKKLSSSSPFIFLSIANLMTVTAILTQCVLYFSQGKVWCFVDVFISYSYLSSVLWTVAFSFDNFGNLRPKRRNMMDSICAQRMCIFQMLCWLLPGVFVFAELYLSFQTWRNWCGSPGFLVEVYATNVVVVSSIVTNIVVHTMSHRALRRRLEETGRFTGSEERLLRNVGRKMTAYILIGLATWVLPLIHSFMTVAAPHYIHDHFTKVYPVLVLGALLFPAQGFLNAFVYGFNSIIMCPRKCCNAADQGSRMPLIDASGASPAGINTSSQNSR